MSRVAVVTDSVASLPEAMIQELNIHQVAYYIQVHHAVVDGQAGVLLGQALFDLTPQPRHIPRSKASEAERPGGFELAAAALKHDVGQSIKFLRHLPDVVKTLAGNKAVSPKPSLGHSA